MSGLIVMESRGETGGTVLTWFVKTTPNRRDRVATASARHVRFDIDDLPPGVFDTAHAAHRELHANPQADIRHYLTAGDGR